MVERFLQIWDPIEIIRVSAEAGVPPSEYDSYAPQVLALLQNDCAVDEVEQYLASSRAGAMGLKPSYATDRAFAQGLVSWWSNHGARASHDV